MLENILTYFVILFAGAMLGVGMIVALICMSIEE
jgi:hypothetical protein